MEKSKSYIKPILLAVLFAVLSLTAVVMGGGTLNSKSPDSQVYATGEVAYLSKGALSSSTFHNVYYNMSPSGYHTVIFANGTENYSGNYSGSLPISSDNYSLSATDVTGETSGVSDGCADVFIAGSTENSTDLYIWSSGTITFPQESTDFFSVFENVTTINFGTGVIDTSNVTNMYSMFSSCYALTSLDLSEFDTSNVTDMSWMFSDCRALTSLDLSNFNTTSVTDMSKMFTGCLSLTSLTLPNGFGHYVTDMNSMFASCAALTTTEMQSILSNLDTTSCEYTQRGGEGMFSDCDALTTLTLPVNFCKNATRLYCMFDWCSNLTSLDLSNLDLSNFNSSAGIFSYGLESLNEIITPKNVKYEDTLPKGTTWFQVTGTAGNYTKVGDALTKMPVGTDSIHLVKAVVVTLNANEGTFASTTNGWTASANGASATKAFLPGETIGDATPSTRTNYIFNNYSTQADGGTAYDSTSTATSNVTYYAQYTVDPSLPVTGVDVGIGTLIASVLATLLIACGLVLVLNKKKRYK